MRRSVKSNPIGERLRSAIEARGAKHAWIAEEAGITAATLSNILTGKTADPGIAVVQSIARAIGQPLAAILEEPAAPLLESEEEVLRRAIEILDRRVLRSQHGGFSLAATGRSLPEAESVPRHEIPAALQRRGARLVFRALGDALSGEGIRENDLLYVKPARTARDADGRLVVCRIDRTLHVRKLIATGRTIRLQAGTAVLTIDESVEFELLGVVVAHLAEL
ncbi:MAG TPA: helix-turn-helix domain-containing protein [Thermoanaerobaculia bacterium]|nr:helix-turn-helix domain-containing protein [Thermoanaerobaculia bacterium]